MSEHRVPAVDSAVEILSLLARRPDLTVKDIAEEISGTRSTTYRILNSLEAGALINRSDRNTYRLGAGVKRLAQSVRLDFDLVALAQPEIEALANEVGFSVKLSIIDGIETLVSSVAAGSNPYAIHTTPGRRFPLYAGAASKVLLAYAPQSLRDEVLSGKLVAMTEQTITEPQNLQTELRRIRLEGWGVDHGEHAIGVHAIAVPVFGAEGRCLGAISIPYFEGQDEIATSVLMPRLKECGKKVSHLLGAE